MKNGRIALLLSALLLCQSAHAQLTVTNGLNLRLDATVGFNANGTSPATWTDQSNSSNSMVTTSDLTEPVFTANAGGSGFGALHFTGQSYMYNNAINSSFNSTEATLFVVRLGQNLANSGGFGNYQSMISIAKQGTVDDEYSIASDWAIHCTSIGNWCNQDHQCYTALPDTRPVILTGVFGNTATDVVSYVNTVKSTNPATVTGTSIPPQAVNRRILIGGRYQASSVPTSLVSYLYEGYVFEMLAYNRKLTTAEIAEVHKYLECKYHVDYGASLCNAPVNCTPESVPVGASVKMFDAYPNPASAGWNISATSSNDQQVKLKLYSITGSLVSSQWVALSQGVNKIYLDAEKLGAGVYVAEITGQNGASAKMQLVKN